MGFTRLRFTKLRQNLSWLRQGLRQGFRPGRRHRRHRRLPTRITLYDLTRPARLAEVDLETAGMNAVFSIHPG